MCSPSCGTWCITEYLLWAAIHKAYAQTQLCSSEPVSLKVSNPKDAAKLAAAALCDNATFTAVWLGNMQLADTIVLGNGTSLTVARASAKAAVINGGNRVPLFIVSGQLAVVNITLTNGYSESCGGAVRVRLAAEVSMISTVFSNNYSANSSGAVALSCGTTTTISGCSFINTAANDTGAAVRCASNCYLTDTELNVRSSQFVSNSSDRGAAV
eukprot:7643-Heterococcus_DN1.PRE.3